MFAEKLVAFLYLGIFVVILLFSADSCHATSYNDFPINGSSIISRLERKPKLNVVSFEPLGQHLAVGLDFLLPFIKIPIVRTVDVYGIEPALININTAALVTTGLLAGSSVLVSYIFRRYVLFEATMKSDKSERSNYDFESELWSVLQNVKVVYKNSTGEKVDTTLTGLLTSLDETFSEKGINLSECIHKALCQRLQQSTNSNRHEYRNDDSLSGIDKIFEGLTGMEWI
ncbi:uncharacterized protein LOC101888699 [Musca domestica]|uniref:Uncharacterized protein LOC101888699 n=1 Tax=Musca domestica TaxID=7370 RepID=A0ABM3VR38_MUSDO|nr:uncharacterized protein LOC101888699 [Musca domestica]